jgi:hypothetical protein
MALPERSVVVVCLMALAALPGCITTARFSSEELERYRETPRVLLAPIDVQLFELTAGGMSEPKAEWTKSARVHMDAALRNEMNSFGAELVAYDEPPAESEAAHRHDQLFKLHTTVAISLEEHEYLPTNRLPTKKDFDWALGDGPVALGGDRDADYALFVRLRDSYASAGRHAVIFLAAAAGYSLQAGQQVGSASLLDLRTGRIVWFNRLFRGSGDVRNAQGAAETVEALLAEFPR